MLDHFDHADDVEVSLWLPRKLVEVENSKTVSALEHLRIRAHVVAVEFKGTVRNATALAQEFEEAAGAAAEIEPAQRRVASSG